MKRSTENQEMRYALIDDHGSLLGVYPDEESAREDLATCLDNAPDVGVVPLPEEPNKNALRQAALRLLTRISELAPGGYR